MAAAGFRIRRIKIDHSIGDRLKRTRIRRKISIAEVEEATKIRAKFLLALESDSWDQIPSEVYGRGYLERYTEFLQLSVDEIMKRYEKERIMYARYCQDVQIDLAPQPKYILPKFLLTPRFFVFLFALSAFIGFTGMVINQISKFTSAPFLDLVSPAQAADNINNELVVSTSSVRVSGKTTIGASVEINGQNVDVNGEGYFSGMVNVQKGLNTIVVKAVNSKEKVTTDILSVFVK